MPHRQALPRFFGVSCLSFCVNEAMYFALLRYAPLDYRVSLAIVLFAVAALTFLLGKLWAFASAPQTNYARPARSVNFPASHRSYRP